MKTLKDATVAIIGLGQIGASIGRALVARRACRRVIGVSRRASTLRTALRLRAAHEACRDFASACARADLVVLATPARTILRQIPRVASSAKPGTLVMDVGSTKGEILRRASAALTHRGIPFVGGHPMAGRSGSGPSSSDPRLFAGHPFILAPAAGVPANAFRLAKELARAVDSRVLQLDPRAHDDAAALISHLPHVLAVSLMLAAAQDRSGLAFRLAAGSFRGATRVAASDTTMLLDILLTNRRAIGRSLARFLGVLKRTGRLIRQGRESALRRDLAAARHLRELLSDDPA